MYKLTIEQMELLKGVKYDGQQYFNPIQDINGDWFISEEEVFGCTDTDYFWVRRLVYIEIELPIETNE
jgi:hypothetical protein